jgi:hypothetical protein
MDSPLFSHPVAEEARPETLATPQAERYGSLFQQPAYAPGQQPDDDELEPALPPREANPRGRRPSGRRGRR